MVRYSRGNIMEDIEARLKLLRKKKKIDTKGINGKATCGAKMLKEQEEQRMQEYLRQRSQQPNATHCPTYGLTNVQKISVMKRWLSVGLFGLASSNVGKSMCCRHYGYKW